MKRDLKSGLLGLSVLVLCLFSYSFQVFSKTIVISDIDDTLKKANSVGKAQEQAYHFLKKIPYIEMRDLFNEVKNNDLAKSETIAFYYVSAAYTLTFDAQEWLQKYHFPLGRSTLKTLKNKESTYDFKHAVIKSILQEELKTIDPSSGEKLHILMFGDNAQADAMVYSDLTREMGLDSQIYIRDVRAEATYFDSAIAVKKIPGVKYYFSEMELFQNTEFDYLSNALKSRTYNSYKKRELIPVYTFKTLTRRLEGLYNDKTRARDDAGKFWNDYYSRF
jgi:phosphatidate phosphatase APP1